MSIQSINPANEEVIETFEAFTDQQIDEALEQAKAAFKVWRGSSFSERSILFHRFATYLRDNKTRLAEIATREMGKTVVEAEAEVEKCAFNCDYYAENAEKFLADRPIEANGSESYVAFQPLGVVLALMPWNFPYWQVMRFAAPTLMAGNTAVLKHASNVSRVALEIEQAFRTCGFPEGVFRAVLVPGGETKALIEDERIAAVTLTGSEEVGIAVASSSGHELKKHVLELGGSDAYIVLADADIDAAAKTAARARNQNNGQSCIAAKRFIVVEAVADEFTRKFVEQVEQLRVGDPLDRETNIGPMARADLRDTLDRQVQETLKQGAQLACGGRRVGEKGYYYAPTVVVEVTPEMTMFREETFGPAAAVIRARDTRHAIELANMSRFGLGGNLWTRDIEQARLIARELESGAVFINGMTASDPRLPFGGVKHSGYGRELSEFGIHEFVNVQTIWIGPQKEQPAKAPSE